ncbi:ribonuclease HII [Pseudomethylobacillus aquaticus]|uniref:Ribonuclease HII n=1 Tax=Pseudomethylobacillus aquaticus TaxID=2676064 RepID=A0A3N0UYE1_9PROT|nr:ribonuclease HII [Pseudomethylobacillus aquaticus]ROH85284.1 ribonuclease HII [Pseudomethylobacillus aquaticus]
MMLCGVDEAGRGPLAGAVFAAAVVLDPARPIAGLADSKTLSASQREFLASEIKQHALAWSIASASVEEIDQLNILWASMLAMQRAVETLKDRAGSMCIPELVQVDGNRCPKLSLPCEAIVKGDSKVMAIAAASILAKTARDADMLSMHAQYPQYNFARHKGYPTPEHLANLAKHGVSAVHRRSYAPVKQYLL